MTVRCDEQMKRSKERCMTITPTGKRYRWRCTGECSQCICAMVKQEDGTWMHIRRLNK